MKDGGTAFPIVDTVHDRYGGTSMISCTSNGMTLRDWFAGQALVGLARNAGGTDAKKERVFKAYAYADLMLAEREK